jgi:hypothetical protein
MGTERHRFSSPTTTAFARNRDTDGVKESRRVTRQDRLSSLADSSSSGSTQDPNITEGIKRDAGIPSIEISDDRGPGADPFKAKDDQSAGPRFGLYAQTSSPNRHHREGFPSSKLAALKKKTYHVLSLRHDKDDTKGREDDDGLLKAPLTDLAGLSGSPTWKRRAVSMPEPNVQKHGRMDMLHHTDPVAARSYLASGSPPIVDFTRFEDRYRSPSSDYDALLSVSRGRKNHNERKVMSSFALSGSDVTNKRTSKGGSYTENGCGNFGGGEEMARNSSGRNALHPATERKPDPLLIMDALENASEMVNIRGLLSMDELSKIHRVDQENFESRKREGETGRKSRAEKIRSEFLFSLPSMTK